MVVTKSRKVVAKTSTLAKASKELTRYIKRLAIS